MSDNTVVYECDQIGCRKSFKTRSGKAKHMKKCSLPDSAKKIKQKDYIKNDGLIQCIACSIRFTCVTNFYRHRKEQHIKEKVKKKKDSKKEYICRVCCKEFPKKYNLQRHELSHSKNDHRCKNCGNCFRRRIWYDKHILVCNELLLDEDQNDFSSPVDLGELDDISDLDYLGVSDDSNGLGDDIGSNDENEIESNASNSMLDQSDVRQNLEYSEIQDDTPNIHDFSYNPSSEVLYGSDENSLDHEEVDIVVESAVPDENLVVDNVGNEYERNRKDLFRKKMNLDSILKKLGSLSNTDKLQVINDSCKSNDISFSSGDKDDFEVDLGRRVIAFLKSIKCFSIENRKLFCSILNGVYGDEISDNNILSRLGKCLDTRPQRILHILEKDIEKRGKHRELSFDIKSLIFSTWNRNSIVTVDRRDGRDVVTIRKDNFDSIYTDLVIPNDIVFEEAVSKRGISIVKTTKRIATKTVRQIKNELKTKHEVDLAIGSIVKFKPFYITSPSEREKESCLCKFCLNIRLRFTVYMRALKDQNKAIPSLSDFFAYNSGNCDLDINGFHKLKCISGTCDDCSLIKPFTLDDFDSSIVNGTLTFYQFVIDDYKYVNKKGDSMQGKRTVRKNVTEEFQILEDNLYSKRLPYLLHRFECLNDIYHWPLIKGNGLGFCFHMDYSENIQNSPKYEVQDAHFNSRQLSLHCTVVNSAEGDIDYAYHFSDNKQHDWAYTSLVMKDLLEKYDGSLDLPVLRFKSDNCSTQYCSRYLFGFYRSLSMKMNKPILYYYGVNGHGRGLVDAMSGFGVKSIIRRAIVTEDFWYETLDDLIPFLEKYKNDKRYYYTTLDKDKIIETREEANDLPIKGCRKSRMFCFFPDGTHQMQRHICSCMSCCIGNFNSCEMYDDIEPEVADEDLDNLDDDDENDFTSRLDFVEEGSFVGLYSSETSFEFFLVCEVKSKDIAEEDRTDFYGHIVKKGDTYITGVYLEEDKRKKKRVYYKKHKKDVYIYPGEVFCPAIMLESDLSMSIEDYLYLCDSV